MIDRIITFTDPEIFNSEESMFRGSKTPFHTNGTYFMCLVRVETEEDIPEGCAILGTYDEVFTDPDKRAVYDSIYIREYLNEEGETCLKPERFGEFA